MNSDAKVQWEQLMVALGKVVLSRTPGVGLVADTFFEYWNLTKEKRAHRFFKDIMIDAESMDPNEIVQEHLVSEEFLDFSGSILRRAVNTASEEKVRRFKKILLNEMKHPYKSDFKETFLDITSRINEDQIQILNHFWEVKKCESENSTEQGVADGGDDGARASLNRERDLLGFDESKYLFYVQDLVSKSLLYDENILLFDGGTKPYTNLRITPFGEEFLRFVEGFPDQ